MRVVFAVLLTLFVVSPLVPGMHATPAADEFTDAPALKGFVRAITGERLDYNCFNPLATTALLTRCTTGEMSISWETEAIPADATGPFIYFKWIVSYATMTAAADRKFYVLINGQRSFVLTTLKGVNAPAWSVKADDGSELAFRLVKEDAARDANGYMFLKVPASKCRKGNPLQIQVVGEKAGSSDWFMTFMYDLRPVKIEALALPFLAGINTKDATQIVCVGITCLAEKGHATIGLENGVLEQRELSRGANVFEFPVKAVERPRETVIAVAVDGAAPEKFTLLLKPVAKRTIYLLPHAHVDIGYTDIQPDVMKKHVKNIHDALGLIRSTAANPPEARFKWNTEVLWAVEHFMATATEAKRQEFLEAVRNGSISLQGLYANVLTGIMRPEEFFRLTDYARSFKSTYGIPVTTAMISDVPGMTWNTVPTLAQSGIRYFSSGPNGPYTGGDRTGHTNRSWADRPFYWTSPSGGERILYWQTGFGYGSFFANMTSQNANRIAFLRSVSAYFSWLEGIAYPYDMIQMRHTINGDNGTVDPDLPGYVKAWNAKYLSPRIVIATAEELFSTFEKKYGPALPAFSGDFTPYWEDGAASTAYELGINRVSSEELVQTEALYAILAPAKYDREAFTRAWRSVLLFDEHTWGAHNSITDPDSAFAVRQWEIKRSFALDGARASAELRSGILPATNSTTGMWDVVNTNSWERTDLVIIPQAQSAAGDVVKDQSGEVQPSQRLSNGDLAFLASAVPAMGTKRYTLHPGASAFRSGLSIRAGTITDGNLSVALSRETGSIVRLTTAIPAIEYVDTTGGGGLNDFLYVAGMDADEAQRNGRPTITVKENGPLVASFLVTSTAPGCDALSREVRMVNGTGRVELINTITKKMVRQKEAVHFGFPFAVPAGTVRIDLGFGVITPDADQLPGSCKDFFSAQRWVDVANQEYGVTLTVAEAPLVEVGELHSELPSPRNVAWRTVQHSSPRLASYVMNNYWHTNYKADQAGVSTYRYSITPHGLFNQMQAQRTGIERSQPLLVRPVTSKETMPRPLFGLTGSGILVTGVKPAAAGKGTIVRLYNASGSPDATKFVFPGTQRTVYLSSPFEEKGPKVDTINLPSCGIATVWIE